MQAFHPSRAKAADEKTDRSVTGISCLLTTCAFVLALGCGINPTKVNRSGASGDDAGDNSSDQEAQSGDGFVYGLSSEEAFKISVYPITSEHCSNCHRADAPGIKVQPYFAALDVSESHKALIDAKKVDLAALDASRLYRRLKTDMHQCWSGDCEADAEVMLKALGEWVEHMKIRGDENGGSDHPFQTAELLASQAEQRSAADPSTILLEAEAATLTAPMASAADAAASGGRYIQVPNNGQNQTLAVNAVGAGVARFNFTITVPGTYQVFGLSSAATAADQSFFIGADNAALVPWILPQTTAFAWSVANNNTATLSFNLTAGAHTLTVRQRQDGSKLDRIAISTAAVYTGPPPGGVTKVLRYDISAIAKKTGVFFEIDLENFTEGALKFRNPRIISSQPVHVKGIHLLFNGQEDQRNATYFQVDKQVTPPVSILSDASMIVVPESEDDQEKIAFYFDLLE